MRLAFCLVLVGALAQAADDAVSRGAVVYRTSCGVAYCHGPEGTAGRAPALAGSRLTAGEIAGIAAAGRPNTSMPAFGGRLKAEDLQAVAAYVVSLGGGGPRPPGKPAVASLPPEVEKGRALFFDSARTGACGACHEVGGRGIPVSLGLANLKKARLEDPRRLATPEVVTVRPPGEAAFPAVIAEKSQTNLRAYDLSSRLPVLRTFGADGAAIETGAAWKHSEAAALYTDAELASILGYLRWAAEKD